MNILKRLSLTFLLFSFNQTVFSQNLHEITDLGNAQSFLILPCDKLTSNAEHYITDDEVFTLIKPKIQNNNAIGMAFNEVLYLTGWELVLFNSYHLKNFDSRRGFKTIFSPDMYDALKTATLSTFITGEVLPEVKIKDDIIFHKEFFPDLRESPINNLKIKMKNQQNVPFDTDRKIPTLSQLLHPQGNPGYAQGFNFSYDSPDQQSLFIGDIYDFYDQFYELRIFFDKSEASKNGRYYFWIEVHALSNHRQPLWHKDRHPRKFENNKTLKICESSKIAVAPM